MNRPLLVIGLLLAASLGGPCHAQSTRPSAAADEAFSQARYQQALELYRQAINAETRLPYRRQLIARAVLCYQALDQEDMAGETFLLLVRDDPRTPFFGHIPLAWLPAVPRPPLERAARAWLARDDLPAAVLLGASHLLAGPDRALALDRLSRLAAASDPQVALLAQAQIWRTQTATVDAAQLALWPQAIQRMPEAARAGPYFVFGQALAQKNQWEQASLALLRVPILFPENRNLAARALLDAGRCLTEQGSPAEAAGVYREVLQKYGQTRSAAEAQMRLEELAQARAGKE